ncbi:hypothetical protein [Microlunatus speluncae]|uniref:hypothetical protein n=1 Tax=Microlunatus speluncae TaxID=2594267 RepID=UPI0012667AEF|nr:hypothetical protein [Microlunatus speluncae]
MLQLLPWLLGALALFCLVIVAKPDLFRSWTMRLSDGDRRSSDDRRVRLGDLPSGLVRVIYLGVAVLLAVFAFHVHSWIAADDVCEQVEQVYDAAGDGWDLDAARAAAAERGLEIEAKVSTSGSTTITTVTVRQDGRVVAGWRTGAVSSGVSCE